MNNEFLPRRGLNRTTHLPENRGTNWTRPHAFATPEDVATHEEQKPETSTGGSIAHPPKPPKKSFKEWLKTRTKKQWIIIGVVAAVLLAGIGFALYTFVFKSDPPAKAPQKSQTTKKSAPASTTVANTLTGLQVDPSLNERPVTAVMIENSTDARPQSGLGEAGVVFEAVAEGGITRFLTLFQDTAPDYIGPVRSVRPYYVQWAIGFDAGVAHVGGSAEGLALVRANKDLDQFFNPAPYHRVSTRIAPHNMYSDVNKLRELQVSKGWNKSDFKGFARKAKGTPSSAPNAKTIDFNISGALYNSHYDYDAATNAYLRSEGGKPHMDERSAKQISADVVIGLVMTQGKNGIYTTYSTIGTGTAYIFQDGVSTIGTWSKTANNSQFTFKDANGAELKLNPGKTWMTVVGSTDRITYKP
jgi:hypothetical protein